MESWRKYLEEEGQNQPAGGSFGGGGASDSWEGPTSDTLDHNINFLLDRNHPVKHRNTYHDDPITDIWWDEKPFEDPAKESAEKAFRTIDILYEKKLKQHLGTGDNGIAFLFEDNTVFKIFMDDDKGTDFIWYQELQSTSRPEDIEIYGFDRISPDTVKGNLRWVNMELTTPLTSIYNPEDLAFDIKALKDKLFLFIKPDAPSSQMYHNDPRYQIFKRAWDNLESLEQQTIFLLNKETNIHHRHPFESTLNENEAIIFTLDLLRFIENHGLEFTGDIHSGNFGLAKNNHYKIFDISGEAPD
jgi:hypothetical protein